MPDHATTETPEPLRLFVGARPFASAADGRPLVELDLRSDPEKQESALDALVELEQADAERTNGRRWTEEMVCDDIAPRLMFLTARLLGLAVNVAPADYDDDGLNGSILVGAELLPEALRSGGTWAVDVVLLEQV